MYANYESCLMVSRAIFCYLGLSMAGKRSWFSRTVNGFVQKCLRLSNSVREGTRGYRREQEGIGGYNRVWEGTGRCGKVKEGMRGYKRVQ